MSAPGEVELREGLTGKALMALEDAIQECRYRTPRPSHAVRFALAYLWAISGKDRMVFDEFWKCLREPKSVWTFSAADRALVDIYAAVGRPRPDHIAMKMWKRWHEHEQAGPTPSSPDPAVVEQKPVESSSVK